jgi:hypothetical protein
MPNSPGNLDDDTITLVLLLAGVGGLGLFSAGSLLKPVRTWMVEHQVLATDGVIVPIGEGAGLDVWRLAIAAGAVVVVLALGWAIFNRRRDSDV